jgi:hypothetical protein
MLQINIRIERSKWNMFQTNVEKFPVPYSLHKTSVPGDAPPISSPFIPY